MGFFSSSNVGKKEGGNRWTGRKSDECGGVGDCPCSDLRSADRIEMVTIAIVQR